MQCNNCSRDAINLSHPYCQAHSDILFFQSDYDYKYYLREERVRCNTLGGWVTQAQADEHATVCSSCDEAVDVSDTYTSECGDIYCIECYDETFASCYDCDEETPLDEISCLEDNYYCEGCRDDNFIVCADCNEWISNEDSCYHERQDETYCEDCYPESSLINAWNYTPTAIFHKVNSERALYMGLEIEVETDNSFDLATELTDTKEVFPEDKFYYKEDGSINGIEIVSHPMTFESIKKDGFRNKLKELKDFGATAYDNGKCGLHIHISKDQIKELTAWKLLYFMFECKYEVTKIAQRTPSQIDEWAKIVAPDEYRHFSNSASVLKTIYPYNDARYRGINFQKRNTIEFRIFRGTLDFKRFWATIEFVYSLIPFLEETGFGFIRRATSFELWKTYVTYLKRKNTHQTLLAFLKAKQLTTSNDKMLY